MSNYTYDYEYTDYDLIGPKKRNANGISYNTKTYYTSNWKTSAFNVENYKNDYIGLTFFDKDCPKSENRNGSKVILTGKRIKHRHSHNHCSIFHCGCMLRDKKKKVQKEEDMKLHSTIRDAYAE